MSKRLQVLLDESELREICKIAREEKMTVAEWVRQALRETRREKASGNPVRKLGAVRSAALLEFPSADIEIMLAEIERGARPPLPR